MKYIIFTPYQQGYQQFIFDFKFSSGILNLNLNILVIHIWNLTYK